MTVCEWPGPVYSSDCQRESPGVHCGVQTPSVAPPPASSDSAFRCFTGRGVGRRATYLNAEKTSEMRLGWDPDGCSEARRLAALPAWSNVGGMPRMLNWTAAAVLADVSFVHSSILLISISSTTGIHLRSCVYDTAIPSTFLLRPRSTLTDDEMRILLVICTNSK